MIKSLNNNLKTKKKAQGHLWNYKKLLDAQAIMLVHLATPLIFLLLSLGPS